LLIQSVRRGNVCRFAKQMTVSDRQDKLAKDAARHPSSTCPVSRGKQRTNARGAFHKAGFTCRKNNRSTGICSYSFSHALPCKV